MSEQAKSLRSFVEKLDIPANRLLTEEAFLDESLKIQEELSKNFGRNFIRGEMTEVLEPVEQITSADVEDLIEASYSRLANFIMIINSMSVPGSELVICGVQESAGKTEMIFSKRMFQYDGEKNTFEIGQLKTHWVFEKEGDHWFVSSVSLGDFQLADILVPSPDDVGSVKTLEDIAAFKENYRNHLSKAQSWKFVENGLKDAETNRQQLSLATEGVQHINSCKLPAMTV